MFGKWIFAFCATLAVGAAGIAATQGLVRVHPPGGGMASARDADPASWRAELTETDLDLREQAFERALRAARRDPALRETLREWAGTRDDAELAWTSRLLLRELSMTSRWPSASSLGGAAWPDFWSPHASTRMDELLRAMGDLHGNLDQLFEDQDGLLLGMPGQGADSLSQGLRLHVGPDGVECEVTTEEDGRKVTRKYEAPSLEELLEQHPELRDSVDLQLDGATGRVLPGGAWDLLARPAAPGDARAQAPLRTDLLGVVVGALPPERAGELDLEEGLGLSVERVEPGTLAEILGVRRGHVLVEINGRPLRTRDDISTALAERPGEGDLRLILIDRFGQRRTRVWKPAPPPAPRSEDEPSSLPSVRPRFF